MKKMTDTDIPDEELKASINRHFEHCKQEFIPFTLSGLADHLGMDRSALLPDENGEYSEDLPQPVIVGATRVEAYKMVSAFTGRNPQEMIQNLTENHGWVE